MRITTLRAEHEGRDVQDGWEHDRWTVTLDCDGLSTFTTTYRMGLGLKGQKPTTAEVLASVLRGADCGGLTFDEFCDEYGYDNDSRRAEKIWRTCENMGKWVKRFLPRLDPDNWVLVAMALDDCDGEPDENWPATVSADGSIVVIP